jgi:hypothetical protein
MQAAQGASDGITVIVLYEASDKTVRGQLFLMPALQKEPSLVFVNLWLYHEHFWDFTPGGDLHRGDRS